MIKNLRWFNNLNMKSNQGKGILIGSVLLVYVPLESRMSLNYRLQLNHLDGPYFSTRHEKHAIAQNPK